LIINDIFTFIRIMEIRILKGFSYILEGAAEPFPYSSIDEGDSQFWCKHEGCFMTVVTFPGLFHQFLLVFSNI